MTVPALNRLRFVAVGQHDPLAEPLLAELAVEYSSRYGATEEAVSKWLRGYPADEFAPPFGGLLIGLLNDVPVTGGAFRRVCRRRPRACAARSRHGQVRTVHACRR